MKKEKILISVDKQEVELPQINFDEITAQIKVSDINEIQTIENIVSILNVRDRMKYEREEFMEKVKSALKTFDDKYKLINDFVEKDIKSKALDVAKKTLVTKTKIKNIFNDETGELIDKKEIKKNTYDLPKGITYVSGRAKYAYDESRIPEKYFKKTLNKTEVKKAIENGELDNTIQSVEFGKPTISLKTFDIKLGLDELKGLNDK